MYYQTFESPTNQRYYSSLNESLSSQGNINSAHIRHPSLEVINKCPQIPNNKIIEKSRVNSQRKLTITAQNNPNFTLNFAKEAHEGLKKQSKCLIEKKGKFMSLKTSQVYE